MAQFIALSQLQLKLQIYYLFRLQYQVTHHLLSKVPCHLQQYLLLQSHIYE